MVGRIRLRWINVWWNFIDLLMELLITNHFFNYNSLTFYEPQIVGRDYYQLSDLNWWSFWILLIVDVYKYLCCFPFVLWGFNVWFFWDTLRLGEFFLFRFLFCVEDFWFSYFNNFSSSEDPSRRVAESNLNKHQSIFLPSVFY